MAGSTAGGILAGVLTAGGALVVVAMFLPPPATAPETRTAAEPARQEEQPHPVSLSPGRTEAPRALAAGSVEARVSAVLPAIAEAAVAPGRPARPDPSAGDVDVWRDNAPPPPEPRLDAAASEVSAEPVQETDAGDTDAADTLPDEPAETVELALPELPRPVPQALPGLADAGPRILLPEWGADVALSVGRPGAPAAAARDAAVRTDALPARSVLRQAEETAMRDRPVTGRLPAIGAEGQPGPAPEAEAVEDAGVADADTFSREQGALARNAQPFANVLARPLMAVVLVDAGEAGAARADVVALPMPVTIAIDPTWPDAPDLAALYREAGLEVVLMAPEGAASGLGPEFTAGEMIASLETYFQRVPAAVGLIDGPGGGLQRGDGVADTVFGVLARTGHGVALRDQGLNSGARVAGAAGIPSALVFRELDAERERPEIQRRYLDRAAFKARQDGHVVMLGRTYPETLAALLAWSRGTAAQSVALAPLSAVLLQEP